jgi:hypothetical protein
MAFGHDLDAADAKALIGPKHVPDSENQDGFRCICWHGPSPTLLATGFLPYVQSESSLFTWPGGRKIGAPKDSRIILQIMKNPAGEGGKFPVKAEMM